MRRGARDAPPFISSGCWHVVIHATAGETKHNQWYKKCVHKNLETIETHDAHTGHTESGWWKIEIQIRVEPNGTTGLMEVPPRTGWRHLLALDDAKFAISARLGYCKCKFILASRKWTWCSKYSAVFHRLHTSTSTLWCSSLVCPFWPLLNHHWNNVPSLFTI